MAIILQKDNSTDSIKEAATKSISVSELKETVEDLCDEADRLEVLINQLFKRKT